MAKPVKTPTFAVPAPPVSKNKLSYAELRSLWIQAGGNPGLASTMAAVALAESGGKIDALNDNPATGDYSAGLWQINYFAGMREGRTKQFGSPETLRRDALANARAAVALAGDGGGLSNWSTYNNGAYQSFYHPQTPAEKTADATAQAQSKAGSTAYVQATTDLSVIKATALANAKATADVNNPWITKIVKNGQVVGFGSIVGGPAPKNVLMIGGQPATKELFQQQWGSTYSNEFLAYKGHAATPAEQAAILAKGTDLFTLRSQWASESTFKTSPIYREHGAGIVAAAKKVLGTKPPDDFVKKAIAQNWDPATFDANLRKLPQYENGPVFKKALTGATDVYTAIYGKPSELDNSWLKSAALAGWDQNTVASKLRSDKAYKYSGEYEANVMGFLDKMGLLIGAQPALSPVKVPASVRAPEPGKLAPTVLGLEPTLQGANVPVKKAAPKQEGAYAG